MQTAADERNLCVFFTLNRSFYPSTSNTTSVRAESSILQKRYKLCGHKATPYLVEVLSPRPVWGYSEGGGATHERQINVVRPQPGATCKMRSKCP